MIKLMIIYEYKIVNYSGGIERVICNLANALIEKNYVVDIVCLDTEKGRPAYHLDERVGFINLAFAGKPYKNLTLLLRKLQKEILRAIAGSKMILFGQKIQDPKYNYFTNQFINRLRKVVIEKQPDIILSVSPDSAYFVNQAAPEIKHIMMCHVDVRRLLQEMTEDNKDKSIFQKVDAVQVLMPSYVDSMLNTGAKFIKCIPNCVNQINRCSLKLDKQQNNRIITVGRVEKYLKRTHLLVEAFCKIHKQIPEWELYIYGNIDSRSYYKNILKIISKYNCENKVNFMGTTDKIIDELEKADIFALPSASEGFSLALTEAMSVGLPVVGYKSCGMVNEIIKDNINGILCDEGTDSLSCALLKLAGNNSLRYQLGNQARNDMELYKPENIWNQWDCFIKKVIH